MPPPRRTAAAAQCLAALAVVAALRQPEPGAALAFGAPAGLARARTRALPVRTPPLQASAGPRPESRADAGSWRSGLRGRLEVLRVQVVLWLDRLLDEQMGASAYNARNRYLLGAWEPVMEENRAVEARVVAGALPADLRGVFLRIGPNPPVAPTKRHHVFDGEVFLVFSCLCLCSRDLLCACVTECAVRGCRG